MFKVCLKGKCMKKANAKIVLYKSYKNVSNEYPVMLRVTKDRAMAYLSTGYYFKTNDWDVKNKRPDKKHPLFDELKLHFINLETDANKVILDLIREEGDFDAKKVIEKLKKEDESVKDIKTDLWEYFDNIIERKKKIGSFNYASAFFETKRILKSFCDNKEILMNRVDHKFLVEFEIYLKSKVKKNKEGTQSPNTIFLFLRTFRTLINYAIMEGLIDIKNDPYAKFSLKAYRNIRTRKRAISKEDMLKIINSEVPEDSHLFDSYNYFVFSYLCWGMNFIDLANLRWSNISDDRLFYVRRKTKNDVFNIPLKERTLRILSYYRDDNNSKNDYVFPILSERHNTDQKKHNRIKKILKQLNSDIKAIAKSQKINIPLTSYVARHTFANVLKNSNVSNTIIAQMMGHETESQTSTYLADFGDEILDNASDNLM
jgi:integrase/recombinase XerD